MLALFKYLNIKVRQLEYWPCIYIYSHPSSNFPPGCIGSITSICNLIILLLAKESQVHSHRRLLLLVLNLRLGINGSEMEDNHVLLEQNLLLEDNPVTQNQEVRAFDIIKQASTIFSKNFNFIIFIFLTSLPLFFFMLYYEIFLQTTLVNASNILKKHFDYYSHNRLTVTESIPPIIPYKSTKDVLPEFVQLGLLYLVPRHLLVLYTIIVTVDLASKIHAEERVITLRR